MDLHRGSGVVLGDREGRPVPLRFGDPVAELEAATAAAGLVDRSYLGRLRLEGSQRAAYLHRISAQAVKDLAPPAGTRAAVLERTGKIVDVLTLQAFPGHLLAWTSASRRDVARDWLSKFIFRDDVQVHDVTAASGAALLLGPRAPAVAAALAEADPATLPPYGWAAIPAMNGACLLRSVPVSGDAFLLLAPSDGLGDLWQHALEVGRAEGLAPVGEEAFQVARILAGLPEGGEEIDEEANPLELGLEDALDMTKGCFTGQEAIAKMITHKAVKRRLVGFDFAGELPDRGEPICAGGEAVGRLTSAVVVPGSGRRIGLALVRRSHAEPGTALACGGSAGAVVGLPFPRV